jgi:hypothetical protein
MLVIKGAYYFVDGDKVLIPHYTGDYHIVDCDRYLTLEELKGQYNDDFIESVLDTYIVVDDVKYYFAEYSPYNVDENWELLSDLSELYFEELNNEF